LGNLKGASVSDFKGADNWWQGVDGKWYPPVAPASESSQIAPTVNQGGSSPGLPQKTKKNNKALMVLGAIVLIVVIFFAVQSSKTENKTIKGTFTLFSGDLSYGCEGSGGYSDIGSSTSVVLKGKDGKEYDRTTLGIGVYSGAHCTWSFNLKAEMGQDYYLVSVGRRGEMKHTWIELDSISVSLGL